MQKREADLKFVFAAKAATEAKRSAEEFAAKCEPPLRPSRFRGRVVLSARAAERRPLPSPHCPRLFAGSLACAPAPENPAATPHGRGLRQA